MHPPASMPLTHGLENSVQGIAAYGAKLGVSAFFKGMAFGAIPALFLGASLFRNRAPEARWFPAALRGSALGLAFMCVCGIGSTSWTFRHKAKKQASDYRDKLIKSVVG